MRSGDRRIAIGTGDLIGTGNLTVTLETDDGAQRYQGIVPLAGQRLAESLQVYFENSEQLPTRLWLHADSLGASGMLLQKLPGAESPAATAATAFVAYGAITFLAVSFGTSLLPTTIGFNLTPTRFNPSRVTLWQAGDWPGHEDDWHVADPFKTMARFPRSDRDFAYRGHNTLWFNTMNLYYYENRYGVRRVDAASARFLLDRSDVARATPTGYRPLERWRLPDGGTLVLYRRL